MRMTKLIISGLIIAITALPALLCAEDKYTKARHALVKEIIDDMKGEPGALPLMSFALRDLFLAEKTTKGEPMDLTLQEYVDHGGINEALEGVQENPSLFLYKVQTTSYKLSWLLIPLSGLYWLVVTLRRALYKAGIFKSENRRRQIVPRLQHTREQTMRVCVRRLHRDHLAGQPQCFVELTELDQDPGQVTAHAGPLGA